MFFKKKLKNKLFDNALSKSLFFKFSCSFNNYNALFLHFPIGKKLKLRTDVISKRIPWILRKRLKSIPTNGLSLKIRGDKKIWIPDKKFYREFKNFVPSENLYYILERDISESPKILAKIISAISRDPTENIVWFLLRDSLCSLAAISLEKLLFDKFYCYIVQLFKEVQVCAMIV